MTDNNFTKSDRLRKRQEFLSLTKKGKKIANQHFIAVFAPGQTQRTRLGVTVTKKVGNAIVRNRIKRLSREYFRQHRHSFKKPWDINLIAKWKTAELPSDKAFKALKDIFDRIPDSFD